MSYDTKGAQRLLSALKAGELLDLLWRRNLPRPHTLATEVADRDAPERDPMLRLQRNRTHTAEYDTAIEVNWRDIVASCGAELDGDRVDFHELATRRRRRSG